MVAESGARLLDRDAERALVELIVPRATVVTPNVPEARVARRATTASTPRASRRAVHALGPRAVVVTGGHRDEAVDLLFDGERTSRDPGRALPGRRRARIGLHALLDAGRPSRARATTCSTRRTEAKRVAGEAVRDGLRDIGRGAGPVNVLGLGTKVGGAAGGL